MGKLKKWATKRKEGFTLVELIVVLVILAILAAILVPALLGWIDRAKEKQYVLDARSVYMAAQARASEKYAKQSGDAVCVLDTTDRGEILKIADPSNKIQNGDTIAVKWQGATGREAYTISGMFITFEDGTVCMLQDGTWNINPNITIDKFTMDDTANFIGEQATEGP